LLLENSSEFLDFIENVDSDYVRLNFDIGHFYCVKEDPSNLVYRLADYYINKELFLLSFNILYDSLSTLWFFDQFIFVDSR
jgi:hypothetical protein